MIKNIITGVAAIAILSTSNGQSNVGINTTNPDPSALLDIVSSDKGLLIPRVSLTGTGDATTISNAASSLLVYNTSSAGIPPNDVVPGFYYWDGSTWVAMKSSGASGQEWLLAGNTGTSPGTDFIGTTDAIDWVIKTNDTERIRVTSDGNAGINTTNPDASALLDIVSSDKGLLIPRVSLTGTGDATTISNAANSLLVYNTNSAGIPPNDVVPGFYYWDGAVWVAMKSSGASGQEWLLSGNTGTSPGTDFIGTTDAVDWVIKTNDTERMRLASDGNVGIGTSSPVASVHINATDGIVMPAGSTAQQPTGVPAGTCRYNTTLGVMEVFNGTCWQNINTPPIGSTYVQWVQAEDPNDIYPCTVWISTDIQNGEFLRATGGNSNVTGGAALTGTVQADAVQNHTHTGSGTATSSGTLTTSSSGTHSHTNGPNSNGVFYSDPRPAELNNGLLHGGHFADSGNSGISRGGFVTSSAGSHTHTIPGHSHSITLSVGNMNTGNASTETRPTNVAVKFWRRTN